MLLHLQNVNEMDHRYPECLFGDKLVANGLPYLDRLEAICRFASSNFAESSCIEPANKSA
jgi:hypothetical protein